MMRFICGGGGGGGGGGRGGGRYDASAESRASVRPSRIWDRIGRATSLPSRSNIEITVPSAVRKSKRFCFEAPPIRYLSGETFQIRGEKLNSDAKSASSSLPSCSKRFCFETLPISLLSLCSAAAAAAATEGDAGSRARSSLRACVWVLNRQGVEVKRQRELLDAVPMYSLGRL
ncbi:hypothetical protein FOA52_008342 [Chlamydomonas sp. UWO 241]|nr:hypothetical protein FOA52_008342 [Chlamydomonas sp. UWO 241]